MRNSSYNLIPILLKLCRHCDHALKIYMCNEQPSQATETPSVEKHAHPPRVVHCAIYLTLTLITKFRVSNLHITTR